MSNGLKFDTDGIMIAALDVDFGSRMLVNTDMATGTSLILSVLYEGQLYNSLAIDAQGRIYSSGQPIVQPGYGVSDCVHAAFLAPSIAGTASFRRLQDTILLGGDRALIRGGAPCRASTS